MSSAHSYGYCDTKYFNNIHYITALNYLMRSSAQMLQVHTIQSDIHKYEKTYTL